MHRNQPGAELTELSAVHVTRLDNENCAYGAAILDRSCVTRDHVIGRCFVPKGKLAGSWNLILNACAQCNRKKSDLEDDLSAISMQPDGLGGHARPDKALASEARRKARRSESRLTGRKVAASTERLTVNTALRPGPRLTFNLWAPPQAASARVFQLARMHAMAFFYWLTYDRAAKRGRFWRGQFVPILEALRSDWGNIVHTGFMQAVVSWEPRLLCTAAADGFFKVAIRKHPVATCWSWAFEWNHNVRVVGFFGDRDAASELIGKLSPLDTETVIRSENERLDVRLEVPLKDEQDLLFVWEGSGPVQSPKLL